jgi:hypothetical protein
MTKGKNVENMYEKCLALVIDITRTYQAVWLVWR